MVEAAVDECHGAVRIEERIAHGTAVDDRLQPEIVTLAERCVVLPFQPRADGDVRLPAPVVLEKRGGVVQAVIPIVRYSRRRNPRSGRARQRSVSST